MPHSDHNGQANGRPKGRRRNVVKQEADSRRGLSIRAPSESTNPNNSSIDDASGPVSANRAFYGRSDAPPPSDGSEVLGETVPLFREVRALPSMVAEPQARVAVEDSFFNIQNSFQDIGKKLKAYNDTLGELQQLGVSHHIELPELVLVGDQSAGKSSLMSGLANLDLPRSEGTCTRCPLHIRVSRNSEWSCRVSLRKEYSYQPPDDNMINEHDVTAQDPFYPWIKIHNKGNLEFKSMSDKSEIEDVLRWAQIAILNDDKNHELFIPGSGSIAKSMSIDRAAAETRAKFSPNIVSLEIKGPELPDLSFYDMPGIFQNPADANDYYLVHVVSNLSAEYINHPSAIIMCSMPMNNDPENSSTFNLIRRHNALSRTIGVCTKADLLPPGQHDQWLKIMKGERHETGLGYFITSRPKDKDLETLKLWEEQVFQNNGVDNWPSDFEHFRDRCGVEKLKAFLSERLGQAFGQSLPMIKAKVHNLLRSVTEELAKLPELPSNAELEVSTALLNFADDARTKIDRFVRHFSTLPSNFRDCLLNMKPKFSLKDHTDNPVVEISDDESEASSVNGRKRPNAVPRTPSKRARTEGAVTPQHNSFTSVMIKPEDHPNGFVPPASPAPVPNRLIFPEPFTRFSNVGRGFRTLRQVREEIQQKTKAGMPNRIPDEVYEDLAMLAVKPWKDPTHVFLTETVRLLREVLESSLNKALESLKKRTIYRESRKHIKDCLEHYHQKTQAALDVLYSDETARLLTFNNESFIQYQKDEDLNLKNFRHQLRMHAAGLGPPAKMVPWEALSQDKKDQEHKKREIDIAKLGADPFDREVEVIGYVRGYYRLAALRYADSVAQSILCRMMPEIRRSLPVYLETKLGFRGGAAANNTAAVYERLLAEDDATAKKREDLKAQKQKFGAALRSIAELEAGVGGDDLHEDGISDTDMVDGEM